MDHPSIGMGSSQSLFFGACLKSFFGLGSNGSLVRNTFFGPLWVLVVPHKCKQKLLGPPRDLK